MTNRKCRLAALLWLGWLGLACPVMADESLKGQKPSNIVCGPRCVQFVTGYYKNNSPTDLLHIIESVQANLEAGSSLADLASYLKGQGLFTMALKPAEGNTIVYGRPSIVHLRGDGNGIGHFVIVLPGSDGVSSFIWSGLEGYQSMPAWELASMVEGGFLLTNDQPIDVASYQDVATRDKQIHRVGWILVFAAVPVIGACSSFPFLKRHQSVRSMENTRAA